ncbi:MAG: toll/interleukin-1 receptor domain-containing protein [Sulfuricaulis sp.]
MRFERKKELSAIISLASVLIAIFGSVATVLDLKGLPSQLDSMLAAAFGAAIAAMMSLVFSRELARRRQARHVFIVYARDDLEVARRLAHRMKDVGLSPWLDVDELVPGQVWKKTVLKALEESSVAVILVSKNHEKGGFVREEMNAAMKLLQSNEANVVPIVPVRIDDSPVPEQLAQIQWVDLREDGAEEKLFRGLARATGLTLRSTGPAA